MSDSFDDFQPATNEWDEFAPANAGPSTRDVMKAVSGIAPEQASEAAKLAKKYNTSNEALLATLQDAKLADSINVATEKLNKLPSLAEYMRTRPFVAAQAHKDVDALAAVHGELKAWKGPEANFTSIAKGLAASLPQGLEIARQGMRAQMGDFLEWAGLIQPDEVYKRDQLRKMNQALGAGDFTRPEIENDTLRAVYGGAESTLRMLPGLAASVLTRNPTPALLTAGVQTQGESYAKYRGRGGAPLESFIGATAEGAIEIATEKLPTEFLTSAMGKKGFGEFFTGLLARELPSEQLATLLQDAVDTAVANPNKTWSEYWAERPEAAYNTLIATVTQTTLVGGASKVMQKMASTADQMGAAERDSTKLQEMMVAAASSMLRENNPETFAELVQHLADNQEGAPKSIYIDGQVLNQAVQSFTPEQLAQAFPSVTLEQIAQAASTNSTVELPIGEVMAAVPGTPLEQVFLQNSRSTPDALSLADAQQRGEQAAEFIKTEADRVLQQAQDQAAWQTSSEAVKTTILAQLNQAGRFTPEVNEAYATLQMHFFSTMAARMGITPQELYDRFSVKVAGSSQAAGPVLNAGTKPGEISVEGYHFSKQDRSTLSTEFYGTGLQGSARDEILSHPDQRLRQRLSFYFDKGTGVRPESGVGGRAHKVNLTGVYDADADPLKLRTGDARAFEAKLLDLGYTGYANRMAGTQPGQVIMLGKQSFTPELLGGLSRIEAGQKLAPLAPAEAKWETQSSGEPAMLQAKLERMQSNPSWAGYDLRIEGRELQVRKKEAVLEQSATLRRGTETLKKYGLKPGQKYKTREVAAALEARQREKYGTIAADDRSPEALAKIAKWMQAEVEFAMDNPESSGVGWYSEKFQSALDTMAQQFPELASDKAARNTMTALIAITSDGQKVVPNFAQAMDIYGRFREGGESAGKFTTTRGHQRQASIDNNLAVLQRLHDQMGAEGMHAYLMQEKTISELKKLAQANGSELKSDYQAHIKMPMAAVEFGPKLGAFYANLMGAHGYLTMDRWWSRSFNRYRGALLQAPTRQGLDRFKELLGNPAMSDDEAIAATVEPRNVYEAKGFKSGTELEKAANTIYKAAFENLEDSPFNATDRTFMLDAVNKAQKALARKGYTLSVADIQAILWYYEKRLYGELGARQTADISYEEAAQRVVAGYAGGSGVESVPGDTGATPEDGGTSASRVPVGEETYAQAGEVNERRPEQTGDRGGRYSSGSLAPLEGAPAVAGAAGPDPRLVAVAEQYARDNGIDLRRQDQFVEVDEQRAARIAQAYAEMQHAPNDPKVKEAYDDLIRQTRAQYDALVGAGYQFTFFDDTTDPYQGNPWNAMRDLRANQRMAVYGTYAGFGVGADLNIGLADPNGGADLDPDAVLAAIKDIGGDVVGSVVHTSATEPTLVIKLKTALGEDAANRLSEALGQEAIAQSFEDGTGKLYGPQAANWGEYNPDFFVTADGRRAAETLNPLLADTGLEWPDQNGTMHPVKANDLFRAVHDAFGHGLEGAGFRARGEENAWQAHVRLFTGSAVGAITSETRGQNSWLNYGPYGEKNRNAAVGDTVFAEQKTGLMPEWTWTEGRAGDMAEQGGVYNQEGPLLAPNGKPSNLTPELHTLVRTPEFKAWFGDWEAFAGMQGGVFNDTTNSVSKAVDENGEPLVVYHGTDAGGFTEFNTPGGTKRGDLGIFTTSNRAMAASYVKRGRATDITRDQTGEDADRVSGVYPVFVNIRNAYETDFEGALWNGERPGQYVVIDQDGQQLSTDDGTMYFEMFDDANTFARENGGTVEPAPDHWETTDSAVREARNSGNDGTIIRNVVDEGGGNSSYAGEPSDVFVALDPTQLKSVENFGSFNPNDANIYKQGPRGTFNPQSLLITLNENADLSTFLHESGHFFLEVMADLASAPDAPQQIRDDMAAILKWFGVPDLATWNGYTLDQKRPYHERWAESFEQYLFEGKAPSAELQPLFRRFRSWLVNVYKSLTEFMRARDLKVSDEIRQVFDRMLATDEQIAQAEETAGMLPDFDATNEAIEKLQARSLRDLKWTVGARSKALKALQKEAANLRKAVEAEVRAEVEQQPIYRAMHWLKKGETTDPTTGETVKADKGFRLNTAALAEMFPETMLARPDLAGLKGMTAKDGLHPDIVADMFGFADGETLVRSILDVEPMTSVIEGMTSQRMLENFGELATPEAIEAAANDAVHNEARARSLATELKGQADALNPRQDTGRTASNGRPITVNALVAAAKEFAENLTARRKVKDLKNAAWQHRSAEARAGKTWQEATAKGKTQEAVQAKRDQVLNNAAVKALQDAQAEVKKIGEFFTRVTKGNNEKTVTRGRDPDVVNAARAILAAYDIAPRLEKGALEYLAVLKANDPAMYAVLEPSIAGAMNNAKPVGEMTMEELRGLRDEIAAMWHLAKRSRQMEVDGNLLDIEDAAGELQERMQAIGVPLTMPGDARAITDAEKRGRWLQHAGSLLRRAEQWAEGMDGKFGGPFLRLVFQPVKEAANRYRADRVKYRKAYQALVDQVAPALRKGPIAAPEIGYTFGEGHNGIGHAELLHAILHTGNESNKRKLLLGRKWATENADGTLDTSRWDAFLQRAHDTGILTKAHYDFAQGVWDLLEQTKPLAQKTHRDVFGRYFAEVTADSFEVPGIGFYRGGYVPAQADPRIVQDADLRTLAETENENMAYSFPTTNKGFTKGRVDYNRPLMLDLRTIGQHIDKVLLFAHMEPAVRDVQKLLSQKGVSYSLGRIDPTIIAGMLTPWLNRSARQIVETPTLGDGGISRVLSAARSRAGMALMFGNVSNSLQQLSGFANAFAKLKSDGLQSQMLRATAQFISSPKEMSRSVAAASEFMNGRMENEIAAINDAMDAILLDPSLYEKAQAWTQKHAYFLQTAFANTMEPIIWTAGYNAALEKGLSEKEAVRYADGLIRQTQGSTLPEDVSRIETGPAYGRIFTQFIGYFNMMANTNATGLKQIASDVGLKKGAGKALLLVTAGMLVPLWIAEAIAQAMRGGPDDEDDDGYLDDWLAAVFGMGTIKGTFAMVPFVGQFANVAINKMNGNPADDRASLSPAVSMLEAGAGVPKLVYQAATDPDKINARNAVRDVASAISIATGLPAYAVARPLGYAAGVADDKIEPTGPIDAARGLVTGTASPESKQR